MPRTSVQPPKKGAKRAAAKDKPAPAERGNGEDRESMIALAAYFRAEQRGFNGGDPVADWLEAEAEVDAMLSGHEEISLH